jgi:hypothetical protein
MKRAFLVVMLFFSKHGSGQNIAVSKEDFVNAVFREVVDSSFSKYYLSVNARPCSFKKFDYDEWYKYALREDVPIYILNELAKNSFLDNRTGLWRQEKLIKANCIDEEKIEAILTAAAKQEDNHSMTKAKEKPIKRDTKNRQPAENNIVFYFSKPAFTSDYEYGVIDISFRCDDHFCGMGATFLFKQANGKWKIVGRKLIWGS